MTKYTKIHDNSFVYVNNISNSVCLTVARTSWRLMPELMFIKLSFVNFTYSFIMIRFRKWNVKQTSGKHTFSKFLSKPDHCWCLNGKLITFDVNLTFQTETCISVNQQLIKWNVFSAIHNTFIWWIRHQAFFSFSCVNEPIFSGPK